MAAREPGREAPGAWQAADLQVREAAGRWLPHALLATVVAVLAFATGWAALGQLDEVTRADGRVITASQVQLVQNLEGGIVAEILVGEGDAVEKGQVLYRIDDIRHTAARGEARQGAAALSARVARLAAEAGDRPLAMPAEVSRDRRALVAEETALYQVRRRDLEAKIAILREQLAQRTSELTELSTREARLRDSDELIGREIAISAPLVKQGVISEIELLRQQREAARIRTELDAATLAKPRLRAAIAEAEKKLEDAALGFRSAAGAELALARTELAKLQETVPALEDRVDRSAVRSPVKGVVKQLLVRTSGGVVQPGSPLAEVVPSGDELLFEVRVRPSDIGFIRDGQRALVKIAAYDYSIYGGLEGEVTLVGPDSVQPQQGEPFYIVHVRTAKSALEFGGRKLAIIPGMTATAEILTGRKSVLDYLLKPVNRARERALTER